MINNSRDAFTSDGSRVKVARMKTSLARARRLTLNLSNATAETSPSRWSQTARELLKNCRGTGKPGPCPLKKIEKDVKYDPSFHAKQADLASAYPNRVGTSEAHQKAAEKHDLAKEQNRGKIKRELYHHDQARKHRREARNLEMTGNVDHNNDSSVRLVANISFAKSRTVKKDGREYVVAPVSMLKEGVLNGSDGPLFYPRSEIAKNVGMWNDIPLVINHPTDEYGNPISASDERQHLVKNVGFLRNDRVKNDRRIADAWFDVKALKRHHPDVLNRLLKHEPIELSTGLFTDKTPVPGGTTWNGTEYTKIASNYRADHLAILPDNRGACSLKDGCGVLVNRRKSNDRRKVTTNQPSHADLERRLQELLKQQYKIQTPLNAIDSPSVWVRDVFDKYVVYEYANKSYKIGYKTDLRSDEVSLVGEPTEVIRVTSYKPTGNCGEDCPCKKCRKAQKLQERTENCKATGKPGPCAEHQDRHSTQLASLARQYRKGKISASAYFNTVGDLNRQFRQKHGVWPKEATQNQDDHFGSSATQEEGEPTMAKTKDLKLTKNQRKIVIDDLINNKCGWSEEDREFLSTRSDVQLGRLVKRAEDYLTANADPEDEDEEEGDDSVEGSTDDATTENCDDKSMKKGRKMVKKAMEDKEPTENKQGDLSVEEWLEMSDAPAAIKSIVINQVRAEKEERAGLIKKITANKDNEIPKSELEGLSLPMLRGLAKAIAPEKGKTTENESKGKGESKPLFLGAASGIFQTNNSEDDEDDAPLDIPTINFYEDRMAERRNGRQLQETN